MSRNEELRMDGAGLLIAATSTVSFTLFSSAIIGGTTVTGGVAAARGDSLITEVANKEGAGFFVASSNRETGGDEIFSAVVFGGKTVTAALRSRIWGAAIGGVAGAGDGVGTLVGDDLPRARITSSLNVLSFFIFGTTSAIAEHYRMAAEHSGWIHTQNNASFSSRRFSLVIISVFVGRVFRRSRDPPV